MADVLWVILPGLLCLPVAAFPAFRNLLRTSVPALIRAKGFG
jgi:hypothetical protein